MNDRHHLPATSSATTYYNSSSSSQQRESSINNNHHNQQLYNNYENIYSPSPSSTVAVAPPQQQQQQQPRYNAAFNFNLDLPLFDYQVEQYQHQQHHQSLPQPLMHSASSWAANGQLTPSTNRARHHRESSLSSLGSTGPASPYTANTSNPQVAGELYYDYHDQPYTHSKPLTPIHTPSQEHFLTPHYTQYYPSANLPYAMSADTQRVKSELMPAPELSHAVRPSMPASAPSNDSPATPPSYDEERPRQTSYRAVPKLERTMTDIYSDELYNPNFTISAAPQTTIPAPAVTVSPHADLFNQRLQAANSQHLSANNSQLSMTVPPRDKSPFRQGSPLAPVGNNFQSAGLRFNSATQMREQQKAEADARALQQQIQRSSPTNNTPQSTISPKDVDLVYHESEEDKNAPLFPSPQSSQTFRSQPSVPREPTEPEQPLSQQSFASMATTRRESSSDNSNAPGQAAFNFIPPSVPGGLRVPQQYPFVPQTRRQPSNMSTATEDFPTTLTSMDSSGSDYASGETSDIQKPKGTAADTGTYTCTYHGCSLRFDTPAKLQRHKREGHRGSQAVNTSSGDESAAAANRNSQAGPHKCERINPSTGKPCNTIFSRPYDLTRHEDTIHNARKQKVHCPVCTEEKTFSRNDALTRHMRVVHPQYADQSNRKRRGGS